MQSLNVGTAAYHVDHRDHMHLFVLFNFMLRKLTRLEYFILAKVSASARLRSRTHLKL